MKRKLIILSILFTVSYTQNSTNSSKLLPSEALALTYHAINSNLDKERLDAIRTFMPRTLTTGLSKTEQFYLGEMYFWNFLPEQADEAYEQLLNEDGKLGRAAWQRSLQVKFRGFGQHDDVEKLVKDYRKKFNADPADRNGLFGQVYNLADLYQKKEDYNKVIELIDDELGSLNYEGAYRSYILPAIFSQSYIKAGKKATAIDLLQKAKHGLNKTLENRRLSVPEKDPSYVVHTERVTRMHTVMTDELGYSQMNEKFEQLIKSIDDSLKRFQ